MRALRVVGLDDGGEFVVCEDPAHHERYRIPADERLRAAARGDLTRLGQIEIELESQMRPREIQARIRAGESIDQVAHAASMPAARVERFAYPVLLERSRTAELAQRAHPVREDGPDVQTLTEVASHTFGLRGQDYSAAHWDSWRGEDGRWVVQLRWRAGRSDNRAHWVFSPGAHGGTVTPLDDPATALLDPNAARPLRTVPRQDTRYDTAEDAMDASDTGDTVDTARDSDAACVFETTREPDERRVSQPEDEIEPAVELVEATRDDLHRDVGVDVRPDEQDDPAQDGSGTRDGVDGRDDERVEHAATGTEQAGPPAPAATQPKQPPTGKRGKKNHPIVPSWEDVLLGVRSTRG